jgi:hypothetical protein
MARKRHAENPDPLSRRALLAAAVTALIVAVAAAVGTRLVSRAADGVTHHSAPVTYSAQQIVVECGTPVFIPDTYVGRVLDDSTDLHIGGANWPQVQQATHAVVTPGPVEVSIQGESSRTITLTGITFAVTRRVRPPGAIFAHPCGDSIVGRYIEADFDADPVRVVASSMDPQATVGGVDADGRNPYQPLTFPWTVSVTDPLLLKLMPMTATCWCNWRADIAWRSGSKHGVIRVDNHGKGYDVVGIKGLPYYTGQYDNGPAKSPWQALPSPRR